jgi:hypothetical protein
MNWRALGRRRRELLELRLSTIELELRDLERRLEGERDCRITRVPSPVDSRRSDPEHKDKKPLI